MIIKEYNKINGQPFVRITSDLKNHYVKVKYSDNEPTNEVMIPGLEANFDFEEVYFEPVQEENENFLEKNE